MKLHCLITRCLECGYEAITWHKNLKKLNCRKCKGKLEILAKEEI